MTCSEASQAETAPLALPALMERLQRCGVRPSDAETIEELFGAWAMPTAAWNGTLLACSWGLALDRLVEKPWPFILQLESHHLLEGN